MPQKPKPYANKLTNYFERDEKHAQSQKKIPTVYTRMWACDVTTLSVLEIKFIFISVRTFENIFLLRNGIKCARYFGFIVNVFE